MTSEKEKTENISRQLSLYSDATPIGRALRDQQETIARLERELSEANERAAGIFQEGRRFLREANSVLRSVYSCLADRPIHLTNWDGLTKRVKEMLDQHHGLRIYEDAALAQTNRSET